MAKILNLTKRTPLSRPWENERTSSNRASKLLLQAEHAESEIGSSNPFFAMMEPQTPDLDAILVLMGKIQDGPAQKFAKSFQYVDLALIHSQQLATALRVLRNPDASSQGPPLYTRKRKEKYPHFLLKNPFHSGSPRRTRGIACEAQCAPNTPLSA